jgi:hypothetical protein
MTNQAFRHPKNSPIALFHDAKRVTESIEVGRFGPAPLGWIERESKAEAIFGHGRGAPRGSILQGNGRYDLKLGHNPPNGATLDKVG